MATTSGQDRDFISSLISSHLLEDAIDWISQNMEPADVFSKKDLEDWAEGEGYVEEED